ncbi:cation:proton antiporter family protein [Algicola sagamiensis]|uniref:cation:proton antiporter family protein n=1 Tax=Algicola sagamiensis TaxID=163869 RepID=UPI0003611204|nr:cation:proton antiporter family protein [Algicola sagamiensis]
MEAVWVFVAFMGGFVFKQIGLPPLVGYLAAGFLLNFLGMQPDVLIKELADLGVTLLLFTIGLKLQVKTLMKHEVWAGALGHMLFTVLFSTSILMILAWLSVPHFNALDWQAAALVGFAISFSSTVVVVKILEEHGEMRSRFGKVAIGILVIQDIAAVLFLTITSGKVPSIWAVGLFFLPFARPFLGRLLHACGHDEILPLAGFMLALAGGQIFESVGVKADLGALVFGVLLSGHLKATELSKALLSFKDIFLIGFFLSIGFIAIPTGTMFAAAFIILLSIPIKIAVFYFWLTRLRLRARSAYLCSLVLGNFSEFGLIVIAKSFELGFVSEEWLVIAALSVSFSFVLSGILNAERHQYYAKLKHFLKKFESKKTLKEDQITPVKNTKILVIGMGRVGTGAYLDLLQQGESSVLGVDADDSQVKKQLKRGHHTVLGDAENTDFWETVALQDVELIMLAMPVVDDMLTVMRQLKVVGYTGKTAAITKYHDDEKRLKAEGVDVVFNFYAEAGVGFAQETFRQLKVD